MTARCEQFAKILRGKTGPSRASVCFVTRMRKDLKVKVLERTTHSPVVFNMTFSYENVDRNGKALCFGRFGFIPGEVERFLDKIMSREIEVKAVHNHWLFESPHLIYIHWEAVMEPLKFARISSNALNFAMGMN